MSKEIIAVVRLMPGQGGFYDPYSRIHLTTGKPQAEIVAGTNCSQLLRSLRSGRLKLVSGSLAPKKPVNLTEKEAKAVMKEALEKPVEKAVEEIKEPEASISAEVLEAAEPEAEVKTEEKAESSSKKKKKSK